MPDADLDRESEALARIAAIVVDAPEMHLDPPGGPPARENARDDEERTDGSPSDAAGSRRDAVDEFNALYAAILVGSRCMVLQERPERPAYERLQLLSVDAFGTWTANEVIWVPVGEGVMKPIPKSKIWLHSPKRRQFCGMVFEPGEGPVVDGAYNLWRGFEVAPNADGEISPFLDHVANNVAGGSPEIFRWVMGWFAHMLQRPRERIGTALALRGGQGAGKTIVGKIIGALIEANYVLIDNPRYLIGQFNAHMRGCLLLQADEGFWAGDKTAEGQLKGLITSDVQMLEHKGVDPIRVKNYVRLLVTSNEEWVIPAGLDERRWAIVDIAPHRAQDTVYFRELAETMADPVNLGALLRYLLSFDLSSVDLRHPPVTTGLFEQKIHSMDAFAAWWLERLTEGAQLPGEPFWMAEVEKHRLYSSYIAAAERVGVRRRLGDEQFGIALRKWLTMPGQKHPLDGFSRRRGPALFDAEAGKTVRHYVYSFPSLAAARVVFEARVRQPVEWLVSEEEA